MLQPAMLSDLSVVASWITSARDCEFWAGDRVRFPIDPETLPDEINYRAGNAFSFYEAGRLIAFGQLIPKSLHRGHFATLIVAPSSRRRGYGEALVHGLLAKAIRSKFDRVSLYVDKANLAAIALYTRFAFHEAVPPSGDRVLPGSHFMERSFTERPVSPQAPLS